MVGRLNSYFTEEDKRQDQAKGKINMNVHPQQHEYGQQVYPVEWDLLFAYMPKHPEKEGTKQIAKDFWPDFAPEGHNGNQQKGHERRDEKCRLFDGDVENEKKRHEHKKQPENEKAIKTSYLSECLKNDTGAPMMIDKCMVGFGVGIKIGCQYFGVCEYELSVSQVPSKITTGKVDFVRS